MIASTTAQGFEFGFVCLQRNSVPFASICKLVESEISGAKASFRRLAKTVGQEYQTLVIRMLIPGLRALVDWYFRAADCYLS